MKKKLPKYVKDLISKYPHTTSGRKNFHRHHQRIIKTLELIKKYFNIKEN